MSSSSSGEQTVTTYDLIVRGAEEAIRVQEQDGSFPPGRNYSYDEKSTPVRTTTQWLRTLAKAYDITSEHRFERAANDAVDFLLTPEFRPEGATYHCRDVAGKDSCNGLVGQASVIRALSFAANSLGRNDAQRRAVELFDLHPFDDDLGLWEIVEIDGTRLSFDRTLNHQLLFAGAAARIRNESPEVRERVEVLLDRLEANMENRSNGLIRHYVHPPIGTVLKTVVKTSRHRVLLRNEVAHHYYTCSQRRLRKERGYQTVNLAGLVEIHKAFPSHPFWESEQFQNALGFVHQHEKELLRGVQTKHGDALPGVSMAKIYREFEDTTESTLAALVAEEVSEDPTVGRTPFESLDVDEETAAALVCELVDLPDLQLHTSRPDPG
ncbi:AGE family epimerase/isomerase [Halorubrum amylolyticum]|uniref:hypothetical protein n=1 Tax=Halorubrum amylolyticum TaxID=2508724 RepID=UPI0010086EE9|nr:hypothetical protein [Halorubrum amylolyticum]